MISSQNKLHLKLDYAPLPKARPRFNGNVVYHDANYKNWLTRAKIDLKSQYKGKPIEKTDGVEILIESPTARGDLDNLIGSVLDALQEMRIKQKKTQLIIPGILKNDNLTVISNLRAYWMRGPGKIDVWISIVENK